MLRTPQTQSWITVPLSVLVVALLFLFGLPPIFSHAALQGLGPKQGEVQKPKIHSVPGEVLVRFRRDSTFLKASRFELSIEGGRRIALELKQLEGAEIVEGLRLARSSTEDTLQTIKALRARPDVLYAEPNFIRWKDVIPNDLRYGEQWALKNTGQSGGTVGADVKAEQAWDITTGSRSIVVGVVDEGIDINHPDLQANVWTNPAETASNGLDDDNNGFVDDIHGWDFLHNDNTVFDGNGTYPTDQTDSHGTHVAGTIGATGNNATGVVGVNWQVSLMSLKFLGPVSGSSADLIRALAYAKMMRDLWVSSGGTKGANIRVLNNSYGGGDRSQAELDAINALAQSEILFVAAAGNEALDNDKIPHYPASYNAPNVIAIASSDRFDNHSFPSNSGRRTVHMYAPGASILSTTPNATYTTASGTSSAAPHVAGAAALICAQFPNTSVQRLRPALMFGGDEKVSFSVSVSGRRLNLTGSLQNISENDSTAPSAIADFRISTQSGRSITLQWTAPGDDGTSGRASVYEIGFSDTNISSDPQFGQASALVSPHPVNAGTLQSATVKIPYRHTNGFIAIRATDNVGNKSAITQVNVSVSQDIADPYIVTQAASSPLSTGGTPLNLRGDDLYLNFDYSLPFPVRYYGQTHTSLRVSTNGALYFPPPPTALLNGEAADFNGSVEYLNNHRMIAGLLDDLRTDRRPGDDVYVVTPDSTRIIFRWQAVTFEGELPVNFEIEFQRDGTILMRYGGGNTSLTPVVGISDGDPDAYVVTSHTSESTINLTNAPTVIYTLRNGLASDIRLTMNNTPNPVLTGQELTYNIEARNFGPDLAVNVLISDPLPVGTTFLSCTSDAGTCIGPAVGTNGTVSLSLGSMPTYPVFFYSVTLTITVRVTAPAGTTLTNTVNVTNYLRDPDSSNNSATSMADVLQDVAFTGVRAISAGLNHTVAVKTDGTVLAWGSGNSGQLGDGTFTSKARPVQVSGLTGVIAVAAGSNHSLALKADGTVWSWGSNDMGQLGKGDYGPGFLPVQVVNLADVRAIAAGDQGSLALKTDGTVWAWGDNRSGQLGNPSFGNLNSNSPMQVVSLTGANAIAQGAFHCLALKTDGTVWVWGNNQFGQLGFETPISSFSVVQVSGVTNVAAIVGGSDYSVIARADGTVWTWGSNGTGQLGDGTFNRRSTPMQINGVSAVTAVAAGGGQVLALKTDGTVSAWGSNVNGILGVGGTSNRPTPGDVIGLTGVTMVAAGGNHSVALLTDGTVRSWGVNTSGQLGDGTTSIRTSPIQVSGLTTVATPTLSLAAGTYNSPQSTIVSCATGGATIRYTTNGQDPTESDQVVASGATISINQTTTLKVKAWKSGSLASAINNATYTISIPTNPIDDSRNFIRQHYLDFLNREPDQGGWDFWTFRITECENDTRCIHTRRIEVSAAFFIELEFQETGYVVYRIHRAAFGTFSGGPSRANLLFTRFMADRSQIVAGPGLPQSTIDFANAFVQRTEFLQIYPGTLPNEQFVNQLFDTANLTPFTTERQQQIDAMNAGKTRAQVLLDLIEIPAFETREFNGAFVLMQYFGYLRRDPDQGGYDFWLSVLNNQELNNYRGMVCAFLTSAEYQRRFGTAVTRTDRDCAP